MPINKNLAEFLQQYRQKKHLSLAGLAEELDIPPSSTEKYCSGTGNPRADTLETLAKKCGVSPEEMISARPSSWERAEIVERAVRLFSSLPPGRRERAVKQFLALVDELSEGEQS